MTDPGCGMCDTGGAGPHVQDNIDAAKKLAQLRRQVWEAPKTLPALAIDTDSDVSHPKHYVNQVPTVEAWDVLKYFPYLRGNAMKYLWRAGNKNDIIQDLRKAKAYIDKEIELILEERDRERQNRQAAD